MDLRSNLLGISYVVSHTEVNNRLCGILRVDDHGVLVNDTPCYSFLAFLAYSLATSAPLMLCHTLKTAPGMMAMG